jgi:F-type H+-transporting ATPase subunit delta
MTELGKEYGEALFLLAYETGRQKEYADALKAVKAVFEEEPQYTEILSSPAIPLKERLSVLEGTFSAILPEQVLSFLMLLCEKGRLSFFDRAVEEYSAFLAASERIFEAKVTSAVPLTEKEKEKLIARLEKTYKGCVRAKYFVDETILGGLIVEVGGKIMDGSLRHRLHRVKEVLDA